jgi:hypothetical protein
MRSRRRLSDFLKIHWEREAGLKVCPKCFFDNCEQIYYHYFFRLSQKRRNEKRDSFFTANVFLPERVGFSKVRRLWESGSSITNVDFSLFRLLRKASAVNVRWTEHYSYLSFSQKSSSWHFLALAKLRSIPSMESPKDIQLVNKGWLSLVRWQLSRSLFA